MNVIVEQLNEGGTEARLPHSMAIQKEAERGNWTPWTPFCKRSMDSSQPDMPQPNWPGTAEICGGTC